MSIYAMIEKTKVIAVLKDIENPPVWPPAFNGEQIFAIECDDSVNIGMYYDAETGLFSTEKTDEIDKKVEKSYDYYDGYVAGKILMNHADISGDEMISKAMAMKPVIETLANSLDDSEALKVPELFSEWLSGNAYEANNRVYFSGSLYKCLQDHTSQSDWTPDVSPSLWVRMDNPEEEWPAWEQPSGSTEAYPKGYKVSHNDVHWISDVDDNVWEPGVYGWIQQ